MSKITITEDEKSEGEPKPVEKEVVEATLREVQKVDKLKELKEYNDAYAKELLRTQELEAEIALGGKTVAGQTTPEKSEQEKFDEEAAEHLKTFEAEE